LGIFFNLQNEEYDPKYFELDYNPFTDNEEENNKIEMA